MLEEPPNYLHSRQSITGCAVIIKTSTGNFQKYINGDDLHIGISDSFTVVHSFWNHGVLSESDNWADSIVVCGLLPFFFNNSEWFDSSLISFLQLYSSEYNYRNYDDWNWNCFDFVLNFLKFINFGNYTKLVICTSLYQMAEFLEDFGSNDVNRTVDRNDFRTNQFQIFTHEYRDKSNPACCAENGNDHSKCAKEEASVRNSKKEIVNITRKLQKALISLEMMNNSGAVVNVLEAIRFINAQLRELIVKNSSEFSATTIPLPEYDEMDMKCFLGDEQIANSQIANSQSIMQLVNEDVIKTKNELNLTVAQAELLLREFEKLKMENQRATRIINVAYFNYY
ncbi:unnamed protein product [Caenorhabditis sp. 36 PRJEB53466]|nr:unnamed protein product [Caenorhabditis sp. 36 PRJEB53466]